MRQYFIIEHPTRGTLSSLEYDFTGAPEAHFSWSGSRNDPEKAKRFSSDVEASQMIDKLFEWKPAVAGKCNIRGSDNFELIVGGHIP